MRGSQLTRIFQSVTLIAKQKSDATVCKVL